MSDDLLHDLIDRLELTATELRTGELDADGAAALVDECARLAGEATAELDRRARLAAQPELGAPPQLALHG